MHIFRYMIFIPFAVAIFVQTIKLIIDTSKRKKITVSNLFSSGGFPSVHSAISASAATLVFLEAGPDSMLFVVTVVFMFLFVYDAVNLRFEAGKHAHYINNLRFELGETLHKKQSKHFLKERLGHTPLEVAGGIILGCICTVLLYKWLILW